MSKLPSEESNLHFKKPITSWDEAIPLGNGLLGCLIWGKSSGLRFSLDRGDIWDRRVSLKTKSRDFTYKRLVELAKKGESEKITDMFESIYREATPTKLPSGKLILNFGESEKLESSLVLSDAHADVTMSFCDGRKINLRSFMHAQKSIGFIEVDCKKDDFSMSVENPQFGFIDEKDDTVTKRSTSVGLKRINLKSIKYQPASFYSGEDFTGFIQNAADMFNYGVFAAYKEVDGKTLIAYTVAYGDVGENAQSDLKESTLKLLRDELEIGYNKSFNEHCGWWRSFWEKSSVTIPDKLFENQWYLTNYLFGSCSRKGRLPMPLQGVWTADDGQLPPWKGDYHNDLNTQLSYLHYLKANHFPEGESYLDFLWNLKDKGEEFAKTFYGTDGICMPSVMSVDGEALGGWAMYSLSPTNQIWTCQIFERHYTYTGDKEFLKERVYPYFVGTGKCIAGLLVKNAEGKYELPVSSSPEIHDNTPKAWVTPNSTYDLSLMRYLYAKLIEFSEKLGEDSSYWKEILDNLPEVSVNSDNVLMLSPDESLMESHRHHSHAMPIYPLRQLDYDREDDRKIIDATIKNLEILGKGWWVGFSFTWMSALYAMQKNGEGAAYHLKLFWENICSPNGFHLNGDYKRRGISIYHYRPFTLEANMSAADSLQEMLLKTYDGVIEPFLAVPHEWYEDGVAFENFRGEDGMYISADIDRISDEKGICSVRIKAVKDGEYTLIMPDGTRTKLSAKAGENYSFTCDIAY